MEDFVSSGGLTNVILVVMAVEVAVFSFFLWRRNQRLGLLSFVASMLSGGSLVLALRAALTGQAWFYVALYLAASLLAHLAEMAIRWIVVRQASTDP